MDDGWMSVDEIVAYLGFGNHTIYIRTSGRRTPGIYVRCFWKFKKDEVDGWIRAGGAAVEARGVQEAG